MFEAITPCIQGFAVLHSVGLLLIRQRFGELISLSTFPPDVKIYFMFSRLEHSNHDP